MPSKARFYVERGASTSVTAKDPHLAWRSGRNRAQGDEDQGRECFDIAKAAITDNFNDRCRRGRHPIAHVAHLLDRRCTS